MKKMLVVYYSWSNGNTKSIAEELAEAKHADLARIETAVPYKGTYDEVVAQGQREVQQGFKPELKPLGVNLDDYDVIAVGTPTWWYSMAPAVKSFLEENDFSEKTVIPFMTNGGWPGHVISDMTKAVRGAQVKWPMEVQFDSNGGSYLITDQKKIDAWIGSISLD